MEEGVKIKYIEIVSESNNTANKRIAKNTIFLSIRMFLVLCINLYATRVVLTNLGVDDYGIYNVVCGFVSLFAFLNSSLSNGIQRFYNYEMGRNGEVCLDKIYSAALLIQILVIVILLLLTETVGLWYLNNKMVIPTERLLTARYIYQLSIISFVFVIFQAPFSAAVLAFERMDYYAIVSVVVTALKLLVALSLPWIGTDRLFLYGLLITLVSVVEFLFYYIYVRVKFKTIRWNRIIDISTLKSMCVFSGWNIFGTFSGIMKEQGINLILNLFFGPVVNAARAIAVQVNGGLQSFVSNFTIPVRPQVVKSYAAGNVDRTMYLTFVISKLSCFFLYVLALPIIAEIDFILNVWLGSDVPEYTASFIIIIIITSFVNNLNAAVSGVVHASGKMKLYQLSTSLVSLLSLPLSYIALKYEANPNIAMIVVLILTCIMQYISLLVLKQIVDFSITDYFKRVVWPVILVIAVTIFIPIFVCKFIEAGFMRLVINFIISIISVLVVVYLIGLTKTEKEYCKSFLKKNLK